MTVYNTRTTNSKDEWETPKELFDPLNAIYGFNLDVAATEENTLCPQYLKDSLYSSWDHTDLFNINVWCNPPFSYKEAFIDRALSFRQDISFAVFLLPNNARETNWWNELVVPYADRIINLIGRVNFNYKGVPAKNCNFPSCLVEFRPRLLKVSYGAPSEIYWDWRNEK